MKINAHAHLLPQPEQIPRFMQEKGIFWVSPDRKFMHQETWRRPIDHYSYFIDGRLEWMESQGIDHEVVLTLSQLYCNGFDEATTRDVIRFQNDFQAELQHEYPSKFTSGFVVQPLHMDVALAEIERCVTELGLSVLCLPTHYLIDDQKWSSVADKALSPIYDLADHYGLAIEFHPYDAARMIPLTNQFWRFHLIWMCAQTADCHHMMTAQNLPGRWPNIRFCFAHGSQFTHAAMGRRIQGYKGRPDLFEEAVSEGTTAESYLWRENIYYDTLVHDVHTFSLVAQRTGADHIVAGLDDPYPLGEMDSVEDSYPGKVIDEALAHEIITPVQHQAIWYQNVINWVTRDPVSFRQRLGIATVDDSGDVGQTVGS